MGRQYARFMGKGSGASEFRSEGLEIEGEDFRGVGDCAFGIERFRD